MRVGVLTSSRADFGIYLPLLQKMQADKAFEVELIVFGTHLSKHHGYTIRDIEASGFKAKYKLQTIPDGDSRKDIAGSIGKTFSSFGVLWARKEKYFDLVLCLGDRYEMFAAVLSGVPFAIPFAHIHGGEKTLGAIDNIYRHSISHAAKLHFTSTESYAERLRVMLDNPNFIYNAGSLSLDNLESIELFTPEEFEKKWGVNLKEQPMLVTFHPETAGLADNETFAHSMAAFINAIPYPVVITMPNADPAGNVIRKVFEKELGQQERIQMIENFGTKGYFTILKHCLFIAGNSSSGIIEAASFGKYVLNVGDRQKGRLQSGNVINVPVDTEAMISASQEILRKGPFRGENIYHLQGSSSGFMVRIIKELFIH